MAIKQTGSDVDAGCEQDKRRRKARRNKRLGALSVAVALALLAVACTSGTQRERNATTPSNESSTQEPPTEER